MDFIPTPVASRFLSESFFSRCSRAGPREEREGASGLRGDETVGVWSSSKGRFKGMAEGVVPLEGDVTSAMAVVRCASLTSNALTE